tara:strand:+ start:28492 stop:29481 length:990 start_codon:yes stop_codon:yes gene_type:complete
MSIKNKAKQLIIISGPTASGKTGTSIALSKKILEETSLTPHIINYDSLYFYSELSIGTAKPSIQERDGIKHSGIDLSSIKHNFNAADFTKFALEKLDEVWSTESEIPILVGGSPFYIRALIKGMYPTPDIEEETKEKVNHLYEKNGIESVIKELQTYDPECLGYLHQNDHYRLTRALEYFYQTGKKISDQKKETDKLDPFDFSKSQIENLDQHHIYLDLPKDDHLQIIKKRTFKMIEDGLLEEIEALLQAGFTGKEKALGSIGYKEGLEYLDGQYPSLEEFVERIVISTRQLAKSQRTFYKKIRPKIEYNPLNDRDKIISDAIQFLTNN